MRAVPRPLTHLSRALQPRRRSIRRPFCPSHDTSPYRLPSATSERLKTALAPFRNREAALALAVFLGRFWAVPSRISGSFPIDRRALAHRADLDLTEGKLRGAIRTLEIVGFINRIERTGSSYRMTEEGRLQRKPMTFVFSPEVKADLKMAIKRAAAYRQRLLKRRQSMTPENKLSASTGLLRDSRSILVNLPKDKIPSQRAILMGEQKSGPKYPPKIPEVNPRLEAALGRLQEAIRG